eukprot:6205147-Pleurochrysis_carterae.AAC.1
MIALFHRQSSPATTLCARGSRRRRRGRADTARAALASTRGGAALPRCSTAQTGGRTPASTPDGMSAAVKRQKRARRCRCDQVAGRDRRESGTDGSFAVRVCLLACVCVCARARTGAWARACERWCSGVCVWERSDWGVGEDRKCVGLGALKVQGAARKTWFVRGEGEGSTGHRTASGQSCAARGDRRFIELDA